MNSMMEAIGTHILNLNELLTLTKEVTNLINEQPFRLKPNLSHSLPAWLELWQSKRWPLPEQAGLHHGPQHRQDQVPPSAGNHKPVLEKVDNKVLSYTAQEGQVAPQGEGEELVCSETRMLYEESGDSAMSRRFTQMMTRSEERSDAAVSPAATQFNCHILISTSKWHKVLAERQLFENLGSDLECLDNRREHLGLSFCHLAESRGRGSGRQIISGNIKNTLRTWRLACFPNFRLFISCVGGSRSLQNPNMMVLSIAVINVI